MSTKLVRNPPANIVTKDVNESWLIKYPKWRGKSNEIEELSRFTHVGVREGWWYNIHNEDEKESRRIKITLLFCLRKIKHREAVFPIPLKNKLWLQIIRKRAFVVKIHKSVTVQSAKGLPIKCRQRDRKGERAGLLCSWRSARTSKVVSQGGGKKYRLAYLKKWSL